MHGISRQVFNGSSTFSDLVKLGETSFWGGYERINDGLASVSIGGNFPDNGKNFGGIPADRYLAANTIIGVDVPTEITGSEVDRWSIALDQAVKFGEKLLISYRLGWGGFLEGRVCRAKTTGENDG